MHRAAIAFLLVSCRGVAMAGMLLACPGASEHEPPSDSRSAIVSIPVSAVSLPGPPPPVSRALDTTIRRVAYPAIIGLARANMRNYPQHPRRLCLARDSTFSAGEDSLVLARLRRTEPLVRSLAACVGTHPRVPNDPPTLRPSPQQWVIWVQSATHIAPDTVSIDGGYFAGGLLAAAWRCRLGLSSNGWSVVGECRNLWFT